MISYDNLIALGATSVTLTYLRPQGRELERSWRVSAPNSTTAFQQAGGTAGAEPRGGVTWAADVEASWRIAGFDRADVHDEVVYTFTTYAGHTVVAGIRPAAGAREPVWLLGPLAVRRTGRTLTAALTAKRADRLSALLQRAVLDVDRVIPSWHGALVAFAPRTRAQFGRVLAAPPAEYAGIAAVTTTVDGSASPRAPVAIVVNPPVFDTLSPLGRHVVISHEATHDATGVAARPVPAWVAEGFADYVGVGSVDVPVSVSAGDVIAAVRRHGPPAALPGSAAFDLGGARLETAYEEAWLACRVIAGRYGQPALVRFYQRVVRQPHDVAGAFAAVLHTTQARFTGEWRRYLVRLAAHD
ncbi:MAG TPA: hypothetical protein VFI30_08875 [Nocardioidaceae bacterium]|nr:hypothetical protein [Nocardioidaceae bacterium]